MSLRFGSRALASARGNEAAQLMAVALGDAAIIDGRETFQQRCGSSPPSDRPRRREKALRCRYANARRLPFDKQTNVARSLSPASYRNGSDRRKPTAGPPRPGPSTAEMELQGGEMSFRARPQQRSKTSSISSRQKHLTMLYPSQVHLPFIMTYARIDIRWTKENVEWN